VDAGIEFYSATSPYSAIETRNIIGKIKEKVKKHLKKTKM